jgi:hypothetical protein
MVQVPATSTPQTPEQGGELAVNARLALRIGLIFALVCIVLMFVFLTIGPRLIH